MKDLCNAIQTVSAVCLLIAGLQGLMGSAQVAKIDVPPWPPDDTKPATAEVHP